MGGYGQGGGAEEISVVNQNPSSHLWDGFGGFLFGSLHPSKRCFRFGRIDKKDIIMAYYEVSAF
jgi:hypothetical protein|nr:hypothetical protein [uncultured Acetatifactor sp.]